MEKFRYKDVVYLIYNPFNYGFSMLKVGKKYVITDTCTDFVEIQVLNKLYKLPYKCFSKNPLTKLEKLMYGIN